MAEIYDVYQGQSVIGKAYVEKQGLYYHISCRCSLTKSVFYRLQVFCEGKEIDLGVCVPFGQFLGLERRIPVKRIGIGILTFRILMQKGNEVHKKYVPIKPEMPFDYISRLNNAYLEFQDKIPFIVIQDSDPAQEN